MLYKSFGLWWSTIGCKHEAERDLVSSVFQTDLLDSSGGVVLRTSSLLKKERNEKEIGPQMLIPPKRIVFTGGGLRGFAHFGVLEVLEQRGLLRGIKEYIGVSAGALVGFCAMLGYTIQEMKQVALEFDFTVLQNAHPELVLDFFSHYGIDSGESIEKFLSSLLRVKGYPNDITFRQWVSLYPKRPRLRCFASDMNMCHQKEYSLEKTPDTSLLFALRASMCLPLYFTPLKDPETGHLLVDGGLIQNFPMNFLSPEEKESALGVSFHYQKNIEQPISDFSGFLAQLYNCGFNPRTFQVQEDNKLQCIIIKTSSLSAYNFDMSREVKEELIESGRKAAQEYCESYLQLNKQYRKPIRRYSVH